VNYNPASFTGYGRTRSILPDSAPFESCDFFSLRRLQGEEWVLSSVRNDGPGAVLRRRTLKVLERAAILIVAVFLITAAAFADNSKPRRADETASSGSNSATSAASSTDATAKAAAAAPDSTTASGASDAAGTPAGPPAAATAPWPLASPSASPKPNSGAAKSNAAVAADEDSEQPNFTPMPALDGNPGLFTLETGETLPKHGWSLGVGLNKFSRMPGDITSLQLVPSVGYGINRWFSIFFQINSWDYIHVGEPSLLSLSSVNAANPQYKNTIYNSIIPSTGFPPAYVEDAPFASHNGSGVGEMDLGFKIGLLSERRGKPISLSIRNDFYLPTKTGLTDLLQNQVQYGKFNYGVGLEASKTFFHGGITATANWSYRFTRDSSYTESIGGVPETVVLNLADQMQVGAGLLVFPTKRFQIMTEYDGTVYIGKGIQNTTFGARDPVDNIIGFRLYAWRWAAMDIGYRYSLDLTNHRDRNGFVIKVGAAHWPEKPLPPDVVTASCAVDRNSVKEGSEDYITANVSATDANGLPLTYQWTATGGSINGSGPYVRWNSTGVGAGSYTLTSRVDNGAGKSASCTANVTVQPKPAPPAPTMTCTADRSTVLAGERAEITANVNDASGTAIRFTWQANAGRVVGSGSIVQFDTSGLDPGTYTVTGRAENELHSACDCTAAVTVQAPPPPPQASKVSACDFAPGSAGADNVCKRNLDDVAVRLQSDPRSKVVLVGYADPHEAHAAKLATERAASGQKYLQDKKGVDASRVEIRTAAGQAGAGKENRRVDIVFVPDGASY
jgi:outer membrane protein OmpA-like peptidoglycan-associated protein